MQVVIDDTVIDVIIIRKKNKNIYFRFDENNNLVVTASKFISDKKILELIEENNRSLAKMLHKVEKKRVLDNETRIWGKKYILVYDVSIKKPMIEDEYIYIKDDKMFQKLIDSETRKAFLEETEKIKKEFSNLPDFTLKIRKMKTRWGVCNYVKNTVTLNSELVKYEKRLLDYVIVHELSHFTHHDHSKNFWGLVEKHYPNYKEARKELRG